MFFSLAPPPTLEERGGGGLQGSHLCIYWFMYYQHDKACCQDVTLYTNYHCINLSPLRSLNPKAMEGKSPLFLVRKPAQFSSISLFSGHEFLFCFPNVRQKVQKPGPLLRLGGIEVVVFFLPLGWHDEWAR